MRLERMILEKFRNHRHTEMDCGPAVNVLLGNNGEGKTNVLEAISFLCLTKSFYAGSDIAALQIGESSFSLHGRFRSDQGIVYDVALQYDGPAKSKEYRVNAALPERLAEVVGRFPLVVLSPENSSVTFGTPADRRKFMDLVLSQASRSYLEDLLEYRRILRQRNRILTEAKLRRQQADPSLHAWNESLVLHGSRVVHRRGAFVDEFVPYVERVAEQMTGSRDRPAIGYLTNVRSTERKSLEEIEACFLAALNQASEEEKRIGSTLVGPHRDELELRVDDLDLRSYASQGQHRTFLVALKVAEFHYLRDRCKETPVLLLDDALGELDGERSGRLLGLVDGLGQTFITSTGEQVLAQSPGDRPPRKFSVKEGRVLNGKEAAIIG